MTRLPLWRSLAATLLLIAVLVALRVPIGNAARQDETRRPTSCDVTIAGGGMGQDGSHMGTPGTGMDRDDSHMDARDVNMPCDDAHQGSSVAGAVCRDMMGSPVTGMSPGANRLGTPGAHMGCVNWDGTPSAGMGCDGMGGMSSSDGSDCDGMRVGCDGMNGSPTAGRDCDGMDRDGD